jgi:transposase
MGKQQKTYTREFKVEAVRLVKSSGKPMSQIARDLGISDSALYQWCKHLADQGEQAFPGSGHQTPQEEEIRRLKRELEITRQERDILKKVVGIYSRESRWSTVLSASISRNTQSRRCAGCWRWR